MFYKMITYIQMDANVAGHEEFDLKVDLDLARPALEQVIVP